MAAYRAAADIECETYGKTHTYAKRGGVLHSEIIAPDHAPDWAHDREALWNAVEQSEMTKAGGMKVRARLAREIVVPLAHELDLETNREALREWVQAEFVSRGMIADVNIHAPDPKGDERNIHAHVMLTMREITPEGFSASKMGAARDWNNAELITDSVSAWQIIQNRELERAGLAVRVDFSSFESRGIDREPEQHEGVAATAMKRKNKETRIGQENEARRDRNAERASLHMKALHQIVQAEEERQKFAAWVESKEANLATYQHKTMSQLEREQVTEAIRFEDRVQEVYAPSLKTVQAEAERMEAIVSGSGIIATARRLIRGRRDREHL
ncbi:MobA/MobL family protein, partial [uncultured Marivita sp.]|uniref:MobA/MobL family protein n=1 Tax=uncultured Marivita sp. TaxID=888080 RepID=UPI00260926E3